jgi:hypothetical protein
MEVLYVGKKNLLPKKKLKLSGAPVSLARNSVVQKGSLNSTISC